MKNKEEPPSETVLHEKKMKEEAAGLQAREQARKQAYLAREAALAQTSRAKEIKHSQDLADEAAKGPAKEKARKEKYLAREKLIAEAEEARKQKAKKQS